MRKKNPFQNSVTGEKIKTGHQSLIKKVQIVNFGVSEDPLYPYLSKANFSHDTNGQ